jgi:hypothetical protein
MRKLIAATTLAVFSLAPAIGGACEYMDDAKADGGTPMLMGAAPPPEASKATPMTFSKAPAPAVKKQVAAKPKTATPEQKVATNTVN